MEKNNRFTLDQLGYLVTDIQTSAHQLEDLLGISPFEISEWPPKGNQTDSFLDGKPANWRMDVAFAEVGGVHLELIQPVSGNPQMEEFVARCGSGLHHLRFTVDDFDQAAEEFQSKGFKVIACGRGVHAGSRWAYFDTRAILNGLIIELRTLNMNSDKEPFPWLARCMPDDQA